MLTTIALPFLLAGPGPGLPLATEAQVGAATSPFTALLQATTLPAPAPTPAPAEFALPALTGHAAASGSGAGEAGRSPAILPLGIRAPEIPVALDAVTRAAVAPHQARLAPQPPAGDPARVAAAPSLQPRGQDVPQVQPDGAVLLHPVPDGRSPQPIASAPELPKQVAATNEETDDDRIREALALPAEPVVLMQPALLTPSAAPTQPVLPVPSSPAVTDRSTQPLLPASSVVQTMPDQPASSAPSTEPGLPATPAETDQPTSLVLPDAPATAIAMGFQTAAVLEVAPQPAFAGLKPLAAPSANEAAAGRGKASREHARPMPVATMVSPGENAPQAEAVSGASAPSTPAMLQQGAVPEAATAASTLPEIPVSAELRPDLPAFSQEQVASPAVRMAPVADARPGELPGFVPQLRATATFTGAEHVTARLFAHQAEEGGSRLTIELDPVELGSIEVSLQRDERGTASATFTVERPETLQLLQRDTRTLVDLLAGAGFSVDSGSLGFELRQEQQEARQQHQPAAHHHAQRGRADGEGRPGTGPAPPPLSRGLLDLRV